MAKKITRIYFRFEEEEFCIDRPYDESKEDKENCNAAVQLLVESMGKPTVVPALHLVKRSGVPTPSGADDEGTKENAFINLGLLPYITIVNVVVYGTKEEEK
jgi:hypothetical protein